MNFIAAVILAVCKGNEDEAFTIFTSLMEDTSFGDYFHREMNFEALQEDTAKIKQKLVSVDAELVEHLNKIGFDLSSVTPAWLLTCFFLPIGPCKTMHVMDNIMRMGKNARRWLINETTVTFLERRRALFACTDLSEIHRTFRRRIDLK